MSTCANVLVRPGPATLLQGPVYVLLVTMAPTVSNVSRGSGVLVCHSGIQGEGGNSQGCHVQGCCMFESTSRLCSRLSLSLQDAHLGAMGQAVNTFVSVSMVGPVTQPQEPATALLGSLGPTAALVRTQFAGLAG